MIDAAAYWAERGKTYEDEARAKGWWDGLAADDPLMVLLRSLHFTTVLDVGCGFGRMTRTIMGIKPEARYLGFDVSADMIASARQQYPYTDFVCADYRAFEPGRPFDLVLAVSSLSYLTRDEVAPVMARLLSYAVRDFVMVDWNETGQTTDCQFAHDWAALLGPGVETVEMGRTTLYHLALRRP